MRLAGRVALITGGSRGIGHAVALAFLEEGARVVLASRHREELRSAVLEMKKRVPGAFVTGCAADVADVKAVERLAGHVIRKSGTIHILVNAAGVQPPIGPFVDVDPNEWKQNLHVNLFGMVSCCSAVLPGMIHRKTGRIINFSGGGATGPRPCFSAYACAKTALVRFTEVLAEEVRPCGIAVNAVAPGAVNTRMLDEIIEAGPIAGRREWDEAMRRKETGGTPPERAAGLAVFLASDESDGITGKLISAPWDPWEDEGFRESLRKERDLATIRRIDNKYFFSRTP